jgi:WD40 repeat protein
VQEVVFSQTGDELQVITTSNDTTVRIWDVETGNQVGNPLEGHGSAAIGLAVSRDGRRIVSGDADGQIFIWDAETKDIIGYLSLHSDRVASICFSPDEQRLVSVSYDGTLKIWNAETGHLVFNIDDHDDRVLTVMYSPNGRMIASGSRDRTVRIRSATTGEQIRSLVHDDGVTSIVWSPNSVILISACYVGKIYFWSAQTGTQLGSPLHAHSLCINALAISPSGELIASASADRTVRLWSTPTRRPLSRVLHHSRAVYTVAFSSNGQFVATGGKEHTIFLWDISQETIIAANSISMTPVRNPSGELDQVTSFGLAHVNSLSQMASDDEAEAPPNTVGPRDASASPSPSLPPQEQSNQIHPTSSSAPALVSPANSFWKRFPMLNRSVASLESLKRWKFPRIGNIM